MKTVRADAHPLSHLDPAPGKLLAPNRMAWLCILAAVAMTSRPAPALDMQAQPPRPPFIAPLPPERPPGVGNPAMIQSPPLPASPAGQTGVPADQQSQPRNLPPASRARMHECALEWQKLKETGGAADKIWYDFAQICLTK